MKKILKISVSCLLFVAVMLSFTSCSIVKPTMSSVQKNLEKEGYICDVFTSPEEIESLFWCEIESFPKAPKTVLRGAVKMQDLFALDVCFIAVEFDTKSDAQESRANTMEVLHKFIGDNWITGINGNIIYACEQDYMINIAFGPLYGAIQEITYIIK